MRLFKRPLVMLSIGTIAGLVLGWLAASQQSEAQIERVIAMSWGDGRHGPGFYGAHVYLEPIEEGFAVRARVFLGRGNDYFHDLGELGQAATDHEAVARWGQVEWKPDGLHLGEGSRGFFLPRGVLENHR